MTEIAVIGVLGGDGQALQVGESFGEGTVRGGQVLDPLAHLGGQLLKGDSELGALGFGGGLRFSGAERGIVLVGVAAAEFGVGRDGQLTLGAGSGVPVGPVGHGCGEDGLALPVRLVQGVVAARKLVLPGGAVVVAVLGCGGGFGAGAQAGQPGLAGGGADLTQLIPDVRGRPGGLDRVGVAQVQQLPVGHAAHVRAVDRAQRGQGFVPGGPQVRSGRNRLRANRVGGIGVAGYFPPGANGGGPLLPGQPVRPILRYRAQGVDRPRRGVLGGVLADSVLARVHHRGESVLFALLTALFNGLASVLQRMAAMTAPASKALHLSLLGYLVKHKVWLAGIAMVVVAAVCQAIALATGPVALVQPIFIIELPFTLLVASRLARRKLPRQTWWAVGLVTVSLGIGLAAAAPSGGDASASLRVWAAALIVTACFEAVVITIGIRTSGNARGAAFGLAAACGYALTATLLKSAVAALDTSVAAFFSSWELYGTAVAGVGALFLLQNALQAGGGRPAAAHPRRRDHQRLLRATVLGENVNTGGGLLAIEIIAVLAIAVGFLTELSRSLAMVHQAEPQPGSNPSPTGCRPARPGS